MKPTSDDVRPWRELESTSLLDCRVFSVAHTRSASPVDDSVHDFYRIESPDWAQIVPMTASGEIVMIRQYRHGSQSTMLEVPAGLVHAGEDPAVAAARECLEETGYRAEAVHSMGRYNPNPALFDNTLHAFYALDVERVAEPENTAVEQTSVVLVPLDEIPALLRSNQVEHALNVMMLYLFLERFPAGG